MRDHQRSASKNPKRQLVAVAGCGACTIVSFVALTQLPASATSCVTVTACIFGENTRGTNGSGIGADAGIFGISLKGDGVDGETTQNSTTTHASSGVAGYDESATGAYNNGVFGYSALGTGVHGTTATGTAVYGNAVKATGIGVYGKAASTGTGVYGYSPSGAGIFGLSSSSNGVFGESSTGTGISGASSSGDGGFLSSTTGYALQAQSGTYGIVIFSGGTGLYVNADGTNGTAVAAIANSSTSVFVGSNATARRDVVSIDNAGNEILAGTLTQSGQPNIRTATSNGATVVAYTARTSSPTLEDFGQAQLSNGAAYVPLDRAFAATIDQYAKYMVFLTPQGDNNGLYVTALSARGFAVRESRGGHSTLAFDYRIVAKPYDTNATRLASTTRFSGLAENRALLSATQRPTFEAPSLK